MSHAPMSPSQKRHLDISWHILTHWQAGYCVWCMTSSSFILCLMDNPSSWASHGLASRHDLFQEPQGFHVVCMRVALNQSDADFWNPTSWNPQCFQIFWAKSIEKLSVWEVLRGIERFIWCASQWYPLRTFQLWPLFDGTGSHRPLLRMLCAASHAARLKNHGNFSSSIVVDSCNSDNDDLNSMVSHPFSP